jgi:hypothetical protein
VGHIGIGEPTYKCAIGCDDGTGGGADPYQRQIWAFDANDVLKSLNGEEARHFPTPYRTWVLPEPGAEGDCTDSQAGAFAYDETTRRIYYAKQYEEDPVIHVLEVAELI